MEKQTEVQFVVCPTCSGLGKNSQGLSCRNCGGLGLGTFFHDYFLYWQPKLGRAIIRLRHLKTGLNLFINLTSLTIGLAGLAALAWWVYKGSGLYSVEPLKMFNFWREKHWLILFFWLSVIADMFVFYRLSLEEARREKIKKFKDDSGLIGEGGQKNQGKIFGKNLPDTWAELKKYGKKIDASRGYSDEALTAIDNAFLNAKKFKHKEVSVAHLFYSLLKNEEVISLFVRLNTDGKKLVEKLKRRLLALEEGSGERVELSSDFKEVLIEAYLSAYDFGQTKVKAINLLLPAVLKDKNLEEILYDLEIDEDKIKNIIAWLKVNQALVADYRKYRKTARLKPGTNMDRAYTAVATPILNHFAYDLTVAAKQGRLEYCANRKKEIKSILAALVSNNCGVILTGPPGVGKRTVIDGLARLMVEEDVPKIIRDKRLVELDVGRLVSGASPAQAEEKLSVIIDEVIRAGNVLLYIENIENLSGISSGEEESLELSEILADALKRKKIFCLAIATDENYRKYIERTPLGESFTVVNIAEPDINQAIQIVESKIGAIEGKFKIFFSYNAIEDAVKLSDKYMHDKYLPAKAIEILETTAVKVADRCQSDPDKCLCTKHDVASVVSEVTRIPVHKVTGSESAKLLKLEDSIHERMIDQEEAVKTVASSLRRARAEMREGKRPIASYMFLGPTGVGKTELAKAVAEIYFGSEKYMIRLDMSEYQHPDSVKKMIGDVNNTLGYLTEAVRRQPFALVLLDEFEKANGDILNIFLQCLDDGRVTDGQGRTIDFTNTIIIATSNAGSVFIQNQVGKGIDINEIKQALIEEHLVKIMKPELINRFDGIIVFKPLDRENVAAIARLLLKKTEKMLKSKGINLSVDEEGIKNLARAGYNPKFGARPLRRVIQDKIENEIADLILKGSLKRRDTIIINSQAEVSIAPAMEI